VVSGQQAGLFTGPLYTIYKAIAAIKLAGCLTQRETKAVPVFWIATEDHDFVEVARAEFISRECQLAGVSVSTDLHREGQPVGKVVLDDSIAQVVEQALAQLPNSEFVADLKELLTAAWQPGRAFGDAFASMMTALLGRYGLVFLDPLDPELKRLAAPLYAEAAGHAPEIPKATEARSGNSTQPVIMLRSPPPRIHFPFSCTMRKAPATHLRGQRTANTERKELQKSTTRKDWQSAPCRVLRVLVPT